MRKKGYTLIELLGVIVILTIIISISIYGYFSYIKNSKEKMKEMEVEKLIDAASVYYKEFENSKEYNSYVDENNITYSCISVLSLINKGYYNDNISFLNEKLTKDNTVIKVKKINSVPYYELITDYKKDEDCVYYDFSSELDNNNEIIINNKDNSDDISLSANIINNPNDKNSYILKLKFTADIYEQIINYTVPLYVMEILDTSGSMRGTKYNNAVNASIQLSNSLIDKFEDSYIGLINFSTNATLKREFSHIKLTTSDFNPASGNTNILHALDLAYQKMSTIDNENGESIKYVIFLTDGVPVASYNQDSRCNSYSTSCSEALKEYSDKIKNDLNAYFVVIGYNISQDIYKTIASIDKAGTICPNSDYIENGNKYCYYNSNSSNISNLFSSISNSIEETVKSQSISESIINIEFDKTIKLYDSEGNEVNDLIIDIKFDENDKDIFEKEYEYYISLDNLDDEIFNCDYEKQECIYNSNLFENFYVDLYDMNRNYLNKSELDSSPIITIKRNLKSYIN